MHQPPHSLPSRNALLRAALALLAAALAAAPGTAAPAEPAGVPPRLRVSENRRFLVTAEGRPFFWLGDTAWELFHRLNREEADQYLRRRAAQGFTVIQAVALAELDGLDTPNAYGHLPLHDRDPARPNEDYFRHVDWIVARANALGLHVGLLPTWGSYWHSRRVIFNPENAEGYGRWLGNRYRAAGLVWILGGDRLVEHDRHRAVLAAMARGLAAGDGGSHLRTFHPRGGRSSAEPFHEAEWLDFNMLQSGHSAESTNYLAIERDYALAPVKPCLDGEPSYEYPPGALPPKRPVGALSVRRNAYWAVFAGAFGHTYGAHPIWQMYAPPRKPLWDVVTPWTDALELPGAVQLIHLKALLLSRPFETRIPDQSSVLAGQGEALDRVQVTRDGTPGRPDASYLLAYFPSRRSVTIATGMLAGPAVTGWWFNPRDGRSTPLGRWAREASREFTPPAGPPGEDWVLVLDDAARAFPVPGTADAAGGRSTPPSR